MAKYPQTRMVVARIPDQKISLLTLYDFMQSRADEDNPNEDKEKAKKMLINYVIGIVIIFIILIAAPLLVRGIAALVT